MNLVASLNQAVFRPAPAERLAAVRILVGMFSTLYLIARAPHLTQFSQLAPRNFLPVGPVSWLSAPLPPSWVLAIFVLALASGIAVTLGFRHRISGPLHGAALLWVLSYRNSWGMVFHTENLLVFQALIVGVSRAADAWSLDSRDTVAAPSGRYHWPLRAMCIVVVLAYVVAGVAKVKASGLGWIGGHELQSHIAFDAVRKLELGSIHSPLGAALVAYEWVFAPLAWLTLAFEFGAPLALLGRRWAMLWCATAWGFHVGVLALMAIVFPHPLLGLAYAPFFRVEKPFRRWILPTFARLRRATHCALPSRMFYDD